MPRIFSGVSSTVSRPLDLATLGAMIDFPTFLLPQTGQETDFFAACSSYATLFRNQASKTCSFAQRRLYEIMLMLTA